MSSRREIEVEAFKAHQPLALAQALPLEAGQTALVSAPAALVLPQPALETIET